MILLPSGSIPPHLRQYFERPKPCSSCYVCHIRTVFAAVWRVLRLDGCLFLNLGDSYVGAGTANNNTGLTGRRIESLASEDERGRPRSHSQRWNTYGGMFKPKDLMGIPVRVVLALQADGWYWRSHIVWAKTSCMPESVTDRPTSAWESIFLLTKAERYFYDCEAVKSPLKSTPEDYLRAGKSVRENHQYGAVGGRPLNETSFTSVPSGANLRNVWTLSPEPTPFAHFATFPTEIPRRAIAAGTSDHGVCSVCGAPWVRTQRVVKSWREDAETAEQAYPAGSGNRTIRATNGGHSRSTYEQTGWQPTCDHGADVIPATVLDPFVGSGTTCLAAKRLGRRSIGIDASAEYLALAVNRCRQLALMPMDEPA